MAEPQVPRGRFAPSPTGPLHLGSLTAALGSWLMARHAGGEWLLRVEDLDPPREKPGVARQQLETLAAFGFLPDGPVLFQSERGEFYAAALFGFQPGELLVEGADEENAAFTPLEVQRQGFFVSGENIAIDRDHPRFGQGATIPLFEDDGMPSSALRKIQRLLGQLHGGIDATRAFIGELLRLKLIEPIDISMTFDDGQSLTLDGLYTVSRDSLNELHDSDIISLFRSGYLQAALCAIQSLNQVAVLARRRNERLTAQA